MRASLPYVYDNYVFDYYEYILCAHPSTPPLTAFINDGVELHFQSFHFVFIIFQHFVIVECTFSVTSLFFTLFYFTNFGGARVADLAIVKEPFNTN
jgi:hypothetical protein